MKKLLIILLFPFCVQAQTVDTLSNAKAYVPYYQMIPLFNSIYGVAQNGITANGHHWMAGVNLIDSAGILIEPQLVRIDLDTKEITTKKWTGARGSTSMFWLNFFDSTGSLFIGLNSNNRNIYKLNFKDSIYIEYIGTGFATSGPLMYSGSLGRDGHVYFGASSGGTYWSEYDPVNKVLTTHPEFDQQQSYVLTIAGDSSWVYGQVGQNTWIKYIAVRKSDGYKKVIDSIPGSGRMNSWVCKDGIYFDTPQGKFKIHDTTKTQVFTIPATIDYKETTEYPNEPQYTRVTSHYDNLTSILYYTIAGVSDSIYIPGNYSQNTIRREWVDRYTNDVLYFGEYYGNTYKNDTTNTLGYIGMNTYSGIQYDDSIWYFGGYPSGLLMRYNSHQPWTAQKYYANGVTPPVINPITLTTWKSSTPAGFHHTEIMVLTKDNYIVAGGTVIRIANTSSVGTYNITTGVANGYDYNKMADWIQIRDIKIWRDYALISTTGLDSFTSKIYLYDYKNNVMADSIQFGGLTGYGKLYLIGDKLIGVGNYYIYNYNLAEKKLINIRIYPSNSFLNSYMMPDGRILVYSGTTILPTDMNVEFVKYNYYQYDINAVGDKLYTITDGGWNIIRLNNYFKTDADIDTTEGITDLIKRKLKMIQ